MDSRPIALPSPLKIRYTGIFSYRQHKMLTNPVHHLSQITDPRRQNKNLLHPLKNILTIALTGILCGYDDWVSIEDFTYENKDWFAKFLDLSNGIPSHDTFGKVMKRLNKDQMNLYFSQWIN